MPDGLHYILWMLLTMALIAAVSLVFAALRWCFLALLGRWNDRHPVQRSPLRQQ